MNDVLHLIGRDPPPFDADLAHHEALLEERLAKGQSEQWYVEHHKAKSYFLIIIATLWTILCPKSRVAWRWFPGLPKPPVALAPFFSLQL